jgi:hypothetical protein
MAVRLSPSDTHARELLATSRYLAGDQAGALDAWTPLGEPRVDTIAVVGATRTSHPTVIRASGLQARRLLTSSMLRHAQRTVAALPVVSRARVSFVPVDGGLADIEVALVERAPVPQGVVPWSAVAGRAIVSDEVYVDVHGALRQAERISGGWRWRARRPRVTVGLAFPSPRPLPGVIAFDAMWEHQTYGEPGLPQGRAYRRRLALRLSDWATHQIQWHAGVAMDRFDRQRYVAAVGETDVRLAGDRLALMVTGEGWMPVGHGVRFGAARVAAAWRSTMETGRAGWLASGLVETVSAGAPLAVWPGAGTGKRGALLRAHPLVQDDVVSGDVFGRRVAAATIEYRQPVLSRFGQTMSLAVFADSARAWDRQRQDGRSPWLVDAGLGVRVETFGGTIRADVATGMRGGGVTWSVGWLTGWPLVY